MDAVVNLAFSHDFANFAKNAEDEIKAIQVLEQGKLLVVTSGILDIVSGMLSAGDAVVDHVVSLASSKDAVTSLRVDLIFSNLLSTIDADKLHAVMVDAGKKPPSLLSIGKLALSADARRRWLRDLRC